MVGEKAIKARLLIQYIESRLSKKRDKFGHAPKYCKKELGVIIDFYEKTGRKGGKRNPEVKPIINDYIFDVGGN